MWKCHHFIFSFFFFFLLNFSLTIFLLVSVSPAWPLCPLPDACPQVSNKKNLPSGVHITSYLYSTHLPSGVKLFQTFPTCPKVQNNQSHKTVSFKTSPFLFNLSLMSNFLWCLNILPSPPSESEYSNPMYY